MSSESTLTFRINVEGANEAAQSFQALSSAAKQMGTEVGSVSGNLDNVGSAAKTAAGKTESFGTSMATVGFGIASVASSVVGLVRSFENISRAEDKSTAANTKLETANARVAKAQDALNAAISKYGPNSEQAAQAAGKLELELKKQADAANRAANASENVGFAYSSATIDAIQFGAGIGSIVSSITAVKTAFGGISTAMSGLQTALTGGATGAAGLATAFATLGLAVGLAVAAFKLVEGGISGADAILAQLSGNTGRAKESWDKMVTSLSQMPSIGVNAGQILQFLDQLGIKAGSTAQENEKLLRSIPGIGNALADVAIAASRLPQELQKIGTAITNIPPRKDIQIAADSNVASTAINEIAKALNINIPPRKDIQISANTSVAQTSVNALADALNIKIPTRKDIQISANSSVAQTSVNAIKDALSNIPPRKDIQIAANSSVAQTSVNAIKDALSNVPLRKDITLNANTSVAQTAINTLIDKITNFKWPTLPSIPMPQFPNISNALSQIFAGFKWPALPTIPMPSLPDVAGTIGRAFAGFKWPQLPAIAMPTLPDIAGGLTRLITGLKWPALPALPTPDTSGIEKAIGNINTALQDTVAGQAWNKLFGGGGGGGRRHGGTDVVTRPTNIRVGEGFHPELITVIPLSKSGSGRGFHAREGGSFMSPGFFNSSGLNFPPTGFSLKMQGGGQALALHKYMQELAKWRAKLADLLATIQATNTVSASLDNLQAVARGPILSGTEPDTQAVKRQAQVMLKRSDANRERGKTIREEPERPKLRHGGSFIVDRPTTLSMRTGGSLVNVAPLGKGGGRGGDDNDRIDRLVSAVEKLARRNQAMEANLIVDGQRMASVTQRYTGMKAYGDR